MLSYRLYLCDAHLVWGRGGSALSLGSQASRTDAFEAVALARALFNACRSFAPILTKRAAVQQPFKYLLQPLVYSTCTGKNVYSNVSIIL